MSSTSYFYLGDQLVTCDVGYGSTSHQMKCSTCTKETWDRTGPVSVWTNNGACVGNANVYAPTCTANICTCPNGIASIANGIDGTLCDTATVDCSQCDAGYKLSSPANSGSASTCIVIEPCTTRLASKLSIHSSTS